MGREAPHTAFFYGTLMSPQILYRVCYGTTNPTPFQKSLLSVRPAILHNYVRHRVKGGDYPAIIPSDPSTGGFPPIQSPSDPSPSDITPLNSSPASSVRGTVVTGLSDGDIWRLDIFEGAEYERREVDVRVLVPAEQSSDKAATGGASEVSASSSSSLVESDEVVRCETYVWIAGIHELDLVEWDFEEFRREKMGRWLGENEYTEVDEAVSTAGEADPTGGRGVGGSISEKLIHGTANGKTEGSG